MPARRGGRSLLCVVVGAGLVWLATALAVRRDFGAGMVAPKPGPGHAAPSLGSPLGLAVRLHRGAVLWWGVSVLALGLVYGSLTANIEDFLGDNPTMEDVLAALGKASLTDSYLATSLLIMALLAAGPALQIVQRLRGRGGRAARRGGAGHRHLPPGLDGQPPPRGTRGWRTDASRSAAWAWALAYAMTGGGAHQVPRLVGAALAYVPAVWLLTALAVALFGLLPRWTAGGWVALTGCLVIGMFGALLDLPGWVLDLSPFQQTPAVPAAPLRVVPLALLTLIGIGLGATGFAAFRARDLAAS